jgi:arsenate reductase (thioredoxin)
MVESGKRAGIAALRERHALALASALDRLASEFMGVFSRETVEGVLDDSVRELSKSKIDTYVPALAERFTRERLGALARTDQQGARLPSVLFLCTHNAGRSQMAAGWLKRLADGRAHVYSGGSEPGRDVNPVAVEAMSEVGIDISHEFPKPWTNDIIKSVDVVVTMGCGDSCPVFPGVRYVDWEVEDPAGQGLDTVRHIRDDVERRVRGLLDELGVVVE